MNEFCETCNHPLSQCGPPGSDGIPTMDCQVCRLTERLEQLDGMRRDSERLAWIRQLMGYVQDGSQQAVTIFQDEATNTFHLKAGNREYWANTFEQVIDNASHDHITT